VIGGGCTHVVMMTNWHCLYAPAQRSILVPNSANYTFTYLPEACPFYITKQNLSLLPYVNLTFNYIMHHHHSKGLKYYLHNSIIMGIVRARMLLNFSSIIIIIIMSSTERMHCIYNPASDTTN